MAPDQDRHGERPRIQLLGGFRVHLAGREVDDEQWPGRRSAELVQLLALAEGHRLTREQCIEALWPHLDPEAGAANLRKAAHQARRALGEPGAVVLRAGSVALFPALDPEVDAESFERRAKAALREDDAVACAEAAETGAAELLPGSPYEEWTQEPRRRLRALLAELLRRSGKWQDLIELEPTDEAAYLELMRVALEAGLRHDAIRWYGRLRTALAMELGVAPSREATGLYEKCVAGLGPFEPEFVDRQVELATATTALRETGRSGVRALLVRGTAGIGKSAFCQRLATVAEEEGWDAISISAAQWSRPYAPIVAAVEKILERLPDLASSLGDRPRSVLAALTPMAQPAPPLEGRLSRHKVIGAVRLVLTSYPQAAGSPVALIVDDAHAADDATAEVLYHLAGGGNERFLAILAYRAEAAREALARGVTALVHSRLAVEIDLGPLDPADAEALVATTTAKPLDDGVIAKIVELGRGNPFFLHELARGSPADEPFEVAPSAWEAIAARPLDLDVGAVAMVTRLAVAGDDLDLSGVLEITGLPEAEAFELLDRALAAGVLAISGARYRFSHELVREALVERLPQHRRIAIHRDAARRLAAADGPAPSIARHWLAGDRPDEAARWLLTAAREAATVGAFADALRQLEPLLARAPRDVEALSLRADCLDALGDSRAPSAYAAAAEAADDRASREIRAMEALARLKAGDPAGALETLDGVEPATTAGRLANALTLAGAAAIGFGDPDLAAREAGEVRRLALELGDPGAIAEASWAQSLAAHARGELRTGLRLELNATRGVPELATRVFDGYLCATERMLHGGLPYEDVIAFADSLAAEAERRDALRGRSFAVTLRGMAELLAGSLEEAEADLRLAARIHREIDAPAGEALALQQLARLALYRSREAEAQELVVDALAAAAESNLAHHLLDRIYGTKLAACSGSAQLAALDEAEAAVRGPAETCPTCRIALVTPAAIAAARVGDLDRAQGYAESAELLAETVLPLPGKRAEVHEAWGQLARAQGDEACAAERFRAAASAFRAAGQPLDEARVTAMAESP